MRIKPFQQRRFKGMLVGLKLKSKEPKEKPKLEATFVSALKPQKTENHALMVTTRTVSSPDFSGHIANGHNDKQRPK
jgi:hypothetical protein